MVETYIKMRGQELIKLAEKTEVTLCFKKEVLVDYVYGMVQYWFEKGESTMKRTNIKCDYVNNVLPRVNHDW